MLRSTPFWLVVLFTLAGCATGGGGDSFATSPAGYLQNARAVVDEADWSKAETIDVALSEYTFVPQAMAFRAGRPYRLRLSNNGDSTHLFVSDGFFKAIAAQKLETPAGTTANPRVAAISVAPGEQKVLSFVPVAKGAYALECTRPLHSIFGMTGTIRIL